MGLQSTDLKKVLHSRYGCAFREHDGLHAVVSSVGCERRQTAIVADGNVLTRTFPKSITSYKLYSEFITQWTKMIVNTGVVTCVVFDEPDSMPWPKVLEQIKRDEAASRQQKRSSSGAAKLSFKTHSSDVEQALGTSSFTCDFGDKYGEAEMKDESRNIHGLIGSRHSRPRLHDEVMMSALETISESVQRQMQQGFYNEQQPAPHIFIDGVDPRGASRDASDQRSPRIVSFPHDESMCSSILERTEEMEQQQREEMPFRTNPRKSDSLEFTSVVRRRRIGEGDIKIMRFGRALRDNEDRLKDRVGENIKLLLSVTTDTDAFAIGLIDEARRKGAVSSSEEDEEADDKGPFNVLCLKRTSSCGGGYECWDMSQLFDMISRDMWSISKSPPSCASSVAAMTLFSIGLSLCKSDFVQISGMSVDAVVGTFLCKEWTDRMIPDMEEFIGSFKNIDLASAMEEDILCMEACIQDMVERCGAWKAKNKSRQCKLPSVSKSATDIKKGMWIAAYWNGNEFGTDKIEMFGYSPPLLAGPSASPDPKRKKSSDEEEVQVTTHTFKKNTTSSLLYASPDINVKTLEY